MKILWLTTDRSLRVAQLFDPLRKAVGELCDLHVIQQKGIWYRKDVAGGQEAEPLLEVDFANTFDIIFTDAPFAFLGERWGAISTPKCALMEDQHSLVVQGYMESCFEQGFTHFFTRYRDPTYGNHSYLLSRPTYWLPHSIDPEVFHPDYPEKQPPDPMTALFTGSVGRKESGAYPLRVHLCNALEGHPRFVRVERPKDVRSKQEASERSGYMGKRYAELLSMADLSFATGSKFRYVVAKYFEIPACGAALMCDFMPEMKDLGFIPLVNCIEIGTKTPLTEQVDYWLSTPYRKTIAENGRRLIHGRHTTQVRARELVNTFGNIIDGKTESTTPKTQQEGQLQLLA